MDLTDADEIHELEKRRFRAITDRDLDSFVELAHPDLTYTHSSGNTDSLESYLAKCRTGSYVYHWIDHPVDSVIVVGDTAIVVGEMSAELTIKGVRRRLDNRSMAVWVRLHGAWKLLAYQATAKQ